MNYYDVILTLVPVLCIVGVLGAVVLSVPVSTGVTIGASLSALIILHALFVNGPTEARDVKPTPPAFQTNDD